MSRRVFVTGAAGFVGVNLVRGLAEAGWYVVATARREPDALTRAFLESVTERIVWSIGDATDAPWLQAQVRDHAPDAIVHAAAVTPTAEVERAATRSIVDTNLVATLTVLDSARASGVGRVLYASSTGIYAAAPRYRPRREDELLPPHNLYALCKLASEGLVTEYARIHGMRAASVRIGSVYGPMERPTNSRSGMSLVASLVEAAQARHTVRVSHVDVSRDLIHAADVVAAVAALLDAPEFRWPVYNVASAESYPVRRVLEHVAELADLRWSSSPVDEADLAMTPGHHRDAVDLSRLTADTGFSPRVGLAAGLAHTLAWHQISTDLEEVATFSGAPL